YRDLGREEERERAITNMVEVKPRESESHEALAEIRECQERWEDAAFHWRRVSELRSGEPKGLLGLAEVLIQMGKWDEARVAVSRLLSRKWPSRFGDVRRKAMAMDRIMEKSEGK
ncbi:MAG: hypothetical protein ACYTFG_00640, partial [Planctomycetota bacterium]